MKAKRRHVVYGALTALFIGLLLPPPSRAAEDECDEALARAQALHERQAQQACELVDRLGLSRSQARKLAPLAEQAAALYVDAYERGAQLLPELFEAFSDFAREDSLNQGFTRQVERRTAGLNHRAKQVQERLDEQLTALEEQAGKILTSSQRERLNERPHKQRPVRRRVWRTDTRTRARVAARQREEARRGPLREARQQLSELHRQIHPQLGPIGRFLLHPFGAERLCKVARVRTPEILVEAADVLRHGTSEYPLELVTQRKVEVRRLRAEINNWNLINGLHLGADQIERIVARYDRAVAPTWEMAGRDRRSGVPHGALIALERDVEQILNAGQRQVLAGYRACLIPPKKLKDPVRVGQVSSNSHYERWLDRARKLSRGRLTKQIDELLKKEAERVGELSRAERRKRVALLRKTVRRASTMSDAEFAMSKADLAESIAPPDRVQELRDKIATLAREYGEPGAVAHFMLKPDFIEQLRLRGRQLAEGVPTEQADLAAGPQAENCDETCAIDGKRTKAKKKNTKE